MITASVSHTIENLYESLNVCSLFRMDFRRQPLDWAVLHNLQKNLVQLSESTCSQRATSGLAIGYRSKLNNYFKVHHQ